MSDNPNPGLLETIEKVHVRMIPPIVAAILLPMTEAGGTAEDVLNLLESVAAGTLAIAVVPAEDERAVATFAGNVAKRLEVLRLAAVEPQGSA